MELVFEGEYRVTGDISGMGGTYEQCCQRMLWLGLQLLDGGRPTDWNALRVPCHIVGHLDTREAQGVVPAIEAAFREDEQIDRGGGITGAMHQFVLQHLEQIHRHGYRWWLNELDRRSREKGDDNRLFLIKDPPTVPQDDDPSLPKRVFGQIPDWDEWAPFLGWKRRRA